MPYIFFYDIANYMYIIFKNVGYVFNYIETKKNFLVTKWDRTHKAQHEHTFIFTDVSCYIESNRKDMRDVLPNFTFLSMNQVNFDYSSSQAKNSIVLAFTTRLFIVGMRN